MRDRFYKMALVAMVLVMGVGCRSLYYSAWEKVGVQKRDMLKERVKEARDDQKEAGEQFTGALTRLKALYGFDGGDLEKAYRGLEKDYDRASGKADDVRKRVKAVETVAGDLFKEWEKELGEMSSETLRERSAAQLGETRSKYSALFAALKRAEEQMGPVLVQFRDQVLFLKHNLNAQAIGSMRGESASIQTDIAKLIEEMNIAIRKADEFIETLP